MNRSARALPLKVRSTSSVILLLAASGALLAQIPTSELTTEVRTLRTSSTASAEAKAAAQKLATEAQPLQFSGGAGEARRKLANAYTLLKGGTWDAKQEYAWSLALRPDQVVSDAALTLVARLAQSYPASYRSPGGLKLRASLEQNGKSVRETSSFDLPARDLIDQPFGFDVKLDGIQDGAYSLKAQISDADSTVASLEAPVQIVRGILTERSSVERRLAKIQGHDSTKASVRYPYILADTVNVGRRQLNGADFGLPFQPQLPYDFVRGVHDSTDLLKALETNKDPLWRAKGDHERHYWFEEANEMMAYHLYAPVKWDGKSKLPMVLVLHGNTRDQDYYFDRDEHTLARTAEQHGFLVVCPMGYRPSAGWGSNSLNAGRGGGGRGGDPSRARQGEYSEKDALNVLDLVEKEYPIDTSRVYLFGHSAGGGGTWYFGEKYPEKWTAIAASAAPTSAEGFPFDRLKGMPIMVIHGDADTEVPFARSQAMVKAAKEHGLDPKFVVMPGATHITVVGLVEPQVFDFFDQHRQK